MWKILKNSIHNRIIAAVFLLILVVNLFSLLSVNSMISKFTNELLTVLSIPVALILAIFSNPKNNTIKTRENNNDQRYFVGLLDKKKIDLNEEMILKRKSHRESIKKKINELFKLECDVKGLIITGDSGAGKSILLRFLENDLREVGYSVYFNDEYNVLREERSVPSKIEADKKYVLIFDQFEGYLDFNVVEDWLCKHRGTFKNCVFVFSFPQKFLTGICNKMYGKFEDFNLQTYVLYLNTEDENEYLNKIAKVSNSDAGFIGEKWRSYSQQRRPGMYNEINAYGIETVLLEELYDVKHGASPLVEMEFLGKMVEDSYGGQDITRKNFIEYKFDKWTKCFGDEETAYAILALFTRFMPYDIEDLKLVTFDHANKFNKEKNGEIIDILDSTDFLTHETGSRQADGRSSNNRLFAPKHEYVCGVIQTYLASKEVPVGIRNYVEYYRVNSPLKEYKTKIKKRYEKYNQSHMAINIFLYVMLAIIFLYNFLYTYNESDSLDFILHRGLFTCISFCSVFYIYNYCDKIMWVGNRAAAIITCLTGLFIVVLSYVMPSWWGVYMGSEIIAFSLCVGFCLASKTTQKAFNNLVKDSITFLAIGISIVLLGIVFINYFTYTDEQFYLLKYSYYPLFFVYVLMSDINHIKTSYIKNKIGYINICRTDNL